MTAYSVWASIYNLVLTADSTYYSTNFGDTAECCKSSRAGLQLLLRSMQSFAITTSKPSISVYCQVSRNCRTGVERVKVLTVRLTSPVLATFQ
jgi:hypothetical protein